jgi:hypothetical protein
VNKKKITITGQKLGFSYSWSEFKSIRPYQRREIEAVLSRLFGKNMAEYPSLSEPKRYNRYVNEVLTNYILIRNVSALEYYLRQVASKIVDNNKGIDFSKFFSDDFETKFAEYKRIRGRRKKLTRGQLFAIQFNFGDPCDIDDVFSRLLGLKFFHTIKKINSRAGKHPWKCCSKGLVKNWDNFMKIFEQRNQIVHSMKWVRLSKDKLCSLCNNTQIFMEQANVLVYGTEPGGSAEQDFFDIVITEQKRLYREEQERTNKPSKQKTTGKPSNNSRPSSTTIDEHSKII